MKIGGSVSTHRVSEYRRRISQQASLPSSGRTNSSNAEPTRLNDASQGTHPQDLDELGAPPQNFARPTLSSINFWLRFIKFSVAGLVIVSGGTALAFEAAHQYVEHFALAPEPDKDGELARWGWNIEAERWTGGSHGGTDPALGFKGAHSLRSAWIAQHWGTGSSILRPASVEHASSQNPVIEAGLEVAHDFLGIALALALERERAGKPLRPETISEIITRHAATLERIGSKGTLYDARADYEQVWEMGVSEQDAAKLALKLGDINARLGDTEEAKEWWGRSLDILYGGRIDQESQSQPIGENLSLPSKPPVDPYAQRILASIISSLSAYYAQSGLLQESKSIQDAGLKLLSDLYNDRNETSMSAPQALHYLYLAHRSSLLTLHRAEVNYTLRNTETNETLTELGKAADLAKQVVSQLVSDKSHTEQIPRVDMKFDNSRTLETPSMSLLRDARRTAMHAWTLSGVLHEKIASSLSSPPSNASGEISSQKRSLWKKLSSPNSSTLDPETTSKRDGEYRAALECYERALSWAGANTKSLGLNDGNEGSPFDDVLDAEWQALWKGYNRIREAILNQAAGSVNSENKVSSIS